MIKNLIYSLKEGVGIFGLCDIIKEYVPFRETPKIWFYAHSFNKNVLSTYYMLDIWYIEYDISPGLKVFSILLERQILVKRLA